MFYKKTKWLDDDTEKLVNRREKIIKELADIDSKLNKIKNPQID
mgnify:CR=1 FL=1